MRSWNWEAGLNVQGTDGRYQPANPEFRITEDGAEATGTAHKLIVSGNIAEDAPVPVVTPDGAEIISRPLGFGNFDPITGHANRFLPISSTHPGSLVASNVIVFSNCFGWDHGFAVAIGITKAGHVPGHPVVPGATAPTGSLLPFV